jgi:hypothetical protein
LNCAQRNRAEIKKKIKKMDKDIRNKMQIITTIPTPYGNEQDWEIAQHPKGSTRFNLCDKNPLLCVEFTYKSAKIGEVYAFVIWICWCMSPGRMVIYCAKCQMYICGVPQPVIFPNADLAYFHFKDYGFAADKLKRVFRCAVDIGNCCSLDGRSTSFAIVCQNGQQWVKKLGINQTEPVLECSSFEFGMGNLPSEFVKHLLQHKSKYDKLHTIKTPTMREINEVRLGFGNVVSQIGTRQFPIRMPIVDIIRNHYVVNRCDPVCLPKTGGPVDVFLVSRAKFGVTPLDLEIITSFNLSIVFGRKESSCLNKPKPIIVRGSGEIIEYKIATIAPPIETHDAIYDIDVPVSARLVIDNVHKSDPPVETEIQFRVFAYKCECVEKL